MSVYTFIAADWPLSEVEPSKEYPIHINVDEGTIYDGDKDDNYHLRCFNDVRCYTDREYGVILEWAYYTKGRARKIIESIRPVLEHVDCVEFWHVWLGDTEQPIIKTATVSLADLIPEDIQSLDNQDIWKAPVNPESRPTFYCLKVVH